MIETVKKAKDYENKNKWDEALREYEYLYENGQEGTHILDKIGWCQSRAGKYYGAINTYKNIIEREPNKAKWHYTLGYQYYSLKQWSNAISCFERAIEHYPNYLIVYYRIGYALKEEAAKNYGESFPMLREAIQYLNNYESIYFKSDNKLQKNNKADYIKVLFLKGKLLTDLDDIKQSIKILEKVHILDKSNKDIVYSLSKAYYHNKEYDRVLELSPKMPNRYYAEELKAKALSKLGHYDKALSAFNKILDTRKKDYIYREVSIIYLQLNELDKAYVNAKESLTIGKENHKNVYLMGYIYYKYKLLILSQKMLLKSIRIKNQRYNSDYREAQELLQEINCMIGEIEHKEDCESTLKHLETIVKESTISRKEGKIVKWAEDRGFGFIKDRSNSYFFHISDVDKKCIKYISEGKIVEFNPKNTSRGLSGIRVNIKANDL